VRIQGEGAEPMHLKKGYSTVGTTLSKMYFEEGLPSWFIGIGPNMIRAIIQNGSVLTVNEIVGQYLKSEGFSD